MRTIEKELIRSDVFGIWTVANSTIMTNSSNAIQNDYKFHKVDEFSLGFKHTSPVYAVVRK